MEYDKLTQELPKCKRYEQIKFKSEWLKISQENDQSQGKPFEKLEVSEQSSQKVKHSLTRERELGKLVGVESRLVVVVFSEGLLSLFLRVADCWNLFDWEEPLAVWMSLVGGALVLGLSLAGQALVEGALVLGLSLAGQALVEGALVLGLSLAGQALIEGILVEERVILSMEKEVLVDQALIEDTFFEGRIHLRLLAGQGWLLLLFEGLWLVYIDLFFGLFSFLDLHKLTIID